MRNTGILACVFVLASVAVFRTSFAGEGALPDNDVVMRAIIDEMARAMDGLTLDDLPGPYLIQYRAQDQITFTMEATYGALLGSTRERSRSLRSRVRVGSYELDNTNAPGSYGGGGYLPIDDDYLAVRHAAWWITDDDYKRAVETLTRKKAFLKDKNIVDRPDDYTAAEAVSHVDPSPEVVIDPAEWEERLRRISSRFNEHGEVQDSSVSLFAAAANGWVIDSEGTRVRTGDTGAILRISARLQAGDGMYLSDGLECLAEQPAELPGTDALFERIDTLCGKLADLSKAPLLDGYVGPVLFDAKAATKVFDALLSDGLCARPVAVGSGGWGDDSLEKKLGRRILPKSFHVVDDPNVKQFGDKLLAGWYTFDDEGVPPQRVSLVENGVLKTLVAGRAPTRKIKGTTGHALAGIYSEPEAHIACLFISDDEGMSDEELKSELIDAAREEGLDFGLRIAAIEGGGAGWLGDPIYAYKVYVDDGREELVRGLEFERVTVRALKRIIAAGKEQKVYNQTSGVAYSVIAPAALFEELELSKIEQEFDKLPILKAPASRDTD